MFINLKWNVFINWPGLYIWYIARYRTDTNLWVSRLVAKSHSSPQVNVVWLKLKNNICVQVGENVAGRGMASACIRAVVASSWVVTWPACRIPYRTCCIALPTTCCVFEYNTHAAHSRCFCVLRIHFIRKKKNNTIQITIAHNAVKTNREFYDSKLYSINYAELRAKPVDLQSATHSSTVEKKHL